MAKTNASLKAMAKDAKGKKPRAPKQSQKKDAPQKTLSTEFVDESDKDSGEGSSSDNESLSEDPVALTNNSKMPAPDGSSSSSENDSDSEEDSEEDSEQESEEDEEVAEAVKVTTKVAKPPTPAATASNAPATYKPPPGFESSSIRDATVSETFKKSHLVGKEIWYFTAPSSVPISTIQNISLMGVENGDSVLSHNGKDYGFTQEKAEDRSYTTIMVPSSDSGYKAVSKPVDQVLHLAQIVKLPGADNSGASRATVPQKKPVRQQPQGLKMRFLPIGFGAGEAGILGSSSDSDVEMQEASKKFKKPILTNSASSSHNDVEKTSKKSKKTVETSSDESLNSGSDEEMAEAPPLPSKIVVQKPTKPSKSVAPAKSTADGTLKRKHGEDSKNKSKKSSSQLTDIPIDKQLKRQKTKQTKSQNELADKLLASTKPLISNTPLPPPPKISPIPPPPSVNKVPKSSQGSPQNSQPQKTPSAKDDKKSQVQELEHADVANDPHQDSEKKKKKKHNRNHESQVEETAGAETTVNLSQNPAKKAKKDKAKKRDNEATTTPPTQEPEKKKKAKKSSENQST